MGKSGQTNVISLEHEMTLQGLVYVQISYLSFSKKIVFFIDVMVF